MSPGGEEGEIEASLGLPCYAEGKKYCQWTDLPLDPEVPTAAMLSLEGF